MDSILDTLPRKYEWLGDMVVLPAGAFRGEPWEGMGRLWDCIAEALGARRILRAGTRRRGEGGVQETERRRETKEKEICVCVFVCVCVCVCKQRPGLSNDVLV